MRAAVTSVSVPTTGPSGKPSKLSDRDLAVLESTLRVQLQVSKCVRAAKVTGAVGAYALSGPLTMVPSGFSIAVSQVQREKLKRRHRKVLQEMEKRGDHLTVLIATDDAVRLGSRAYAISAATGLVCCLFAFSADILIDHAVAQVVSEAIRGYADELIVGSLTAHMAARSLTPCPNSTTTPESQTQEPKTPKKKLTWAGLMAKWKASRASNQTESEPPDLFGEREVAVENCPPRNVEVERSDEFDLFGECLVVRFPPHETGGHGHSDPRETERDRKEGNLSQTNATFDGEPNAELSEAQWRSLWTLEDGPVDQASRDEQENDDCDLFGAGLRPSKTTEANDHDLFGVSGRAEHADTEDADLFGLSGAKSQPRG